MQIIDKQNRIKLRQCCGELATRVENYIERGLSINPGTLLHELLDELHIRSVNDIFECPPIKHDDESVITKDTYKLILIPPEVATLKADVWRDPEHHVGTVRLRMEARTTSQETWGKFAEHMRQWERYIRNLEELDSLLVWTIPASVSDWSNAWSFSSTEVNRLCRQGENEGWAERVPKQKWRFRIEYLEAMGWKSTPGIQS